MAVAGKNLVKFMSEGSVLVFVTKKQNCEELGHNLKVKAEIDCRCLHGDMFQTERNDIIGAFKKQEFPVLVATDVAAPADSLAAVATPVARVASPMSRPAPPPRTSTPVVLDVAGGDMVGTIPR